MSSITFSLPTIVFQNKFKIIPQQPNDHQEEAKIAQNNRDSADC
jgi:hypothetical protein